jgi:protein O-GlcNAc transferase
MTIPQAFALALQRHQAGRLAEAEALYRQILAVQPNHADALHMLGILAHQAGQPGAADLIRQAIAVNPADLRYHSNLGNVLAAQGLFEEAIAAYRRALQIDPNYVDAHYNAGIALQNLGRLDEAIAAYRATIQSRPDFALAHNNLGAALKAKGRFDEAIAAYRKALRIDPNYLEAHNNLGVALHEQGNFAEAAEACRRALQINPNYADAWYNLGNASQDQGHLDEAIAAYLRALALKPDFSKAHNNLGNALRDRGRLDETVASYRRALELEPGYLEARVNLGAALALQGHLDEAIVEYRRVLELKPDFPEAHNNLANALKEQGRLDEAIAEYRHALQIEPDASTHSNLVFTLHFHPGHDLRSIAAEHQRWNRQFSEPLKPCVQPHRRDPATAGPLRIGYVSPDFRDHPVGRFVLPLFERHDRERFEVLCYSGTARPDGLTKRLRALAGGWRSTVGVPDARLAEMIREDGVDILVDLAMHTSGNRLLVFARQPAPVQVAWLAYPGSSGLPGIGYRLTDARMDPPGEQSACSAEEPMRLPDCWCCYDPAGDSPEINVLPALAAGYVTFGSLNAFAKVNEGVLALWARVLEAVNGSRLLLFCPEGRTRERVSAFFGARGIAPDRVELAGFLPWWEYLSLYQRIDIALDPFPCNGMTTTCDALWMGAPVLTLPGQTPVSRAGLSLLSSIGLAELAASSEGDYVRLAVELAGDLQRLADLRATLRSRMRASPLMDAPRFARNIEAAYRSMWERWLSTGV